MPVERIVIKKGKSTGPLKKIKRFTEREKKEIIIILVVIILTLLFFSWAFSEFNFIELSVFIILLLMFVAYTFLTSLSNPNNSVEIFKDGENLKKICVGNRCFYPYAIPGILLLGAVYIMKLRKNYKIVVVPLFLTPSKAYITKKQFDGVMEILTSSKNIKFHKLYKVNMASSFYGIVEDYADVYDEKTLEKMEKSGERILNKEFIGIAISHPSANPEVLIELMMRYEDSNIL